jgi:hypothetical protein
MATDTAMRRWDLRSGRELSRRAAGSPYQLRFSPDSKVLAAMTDGHILRWRLSIPDTPVYRHALVNKQPEEFEFNLPTPTLRYPPRTARQHLQRAGARGDHTPARHRQRLSPVAADPGRPHPRPLPIPATRNDTPQTAQGVTLWNGDVRTRLGVLAGTYTGAPFPAADSNAAALAFSPDGRTLAVAGLSGTLQL